MIATLAAIGAAAVGVVAHGAFQRNSPFFGRVIARVPANGTPRVAITFDDGPNPVATPLILDALRADGAHATFFMLGRHVERWPDIATRVADEGHAIGNHGYFHRKLHRRSPADVRLDIQLGARAIHDATGVAPVLFRAPHGFRSPWLSTIAADLGQRTVGWTLGVWDSDRPGSHVIQSRALDGIRAGGILLLHDGDGYDPQGDRLQTAEAVPGIVRDLRDRGFELVRLA